MTNEVADLNLLSPFPQISTGFCTLGMPSPAAIAGLVLGAVLGVGLVCLGAYTMHRYMDWRCRELVHLFQSNTVRVVRIEDIETGNKTREHSGDEEKGCNATTLAWVPGRSQHQPIISGSHNTIELRGGSEHGSVQVDSNWAEMRQMQAYVPRSARMQAQPTTHRQALRWHQSETAYDRMMQPPAFSRQAAPQGGWYGYIPPRSGAALAQQFGHSGPSHGLVRQEEQQRANVGEAQQTSRNSVRIPAAAPNAQGRIGPIVLEGDSIEILDDYSYLIEGVISVKRKQKRKREKKCRVHERRRSSSTELGTCSDSRSSIEATPRGCIVEGGPHLAHLPPSSYFPRSERVRHAAHDDSGGNPTTQLSQCNEDGQGYKRRGGGRLGTRSKLTERGRRQACNASPASAVPVGTFSRRV